MKELDDISLVTQVAVFHNRKAFDKLVVKYQSPIRRFFLTQTGGDNQLSDDATQETPQVQIPHNINKDLVRQEKSWKLR